MKTIMSKSSHDSSFSFSRRYFHWKKKLDDNEDDDEEILTFSCSSHFFQDDKEYDGHKIDVPNELSTPRKKHSLMSVSKLRSALGIFGSKNKRHHPSGLGTKVIGTLFGYRRGHVHFAFQECTTKLHPALLIELAIPTSVLVKEMASGLVRMALECDKKFQKRCVKLLDEPLWRTYCNGKKCGYALKRECGPEECRILKAVEPISTGAGVLPGKSEDDGSEGEVMYMRAKFERVIGSKDSEAFYMMNPDGSGGGPELSIYLLRV